MVVQQKLNQTIKKLITLKEILWTDGFDFIQIISIYFWVIILTVTFDFIIIVLDQRSFFGLRPKIIGKITEETNYNDKEVKNV